MSGGAYKKCDCCSRLFPEDELETVVIKIKKCKTCNPNIDSMIQTRPELKSLGAPVRRPASIAEVSMKPPSPDDEGVPLKK
jgi:hypothetical protein